ncbi:MAG: hypothetical protein ACO1Q7_02030 [Gemmatimonas sp.]
MIRRVVFAGRHLRNVRIDVAALKTPEGREQLLRDMAEYEAECQRAFTARMMRPQMPRIAS